jgi:ABC-type phosphate/phosphonate transport system permease subunit
MALTTLDQIQAHASGLERQRRIYTGLGVAIFVVLVVLGFGAAEEMNSGGFVDGLSKFFDYPRNIVIETGEAGTGWFERLWVYLPALIETINMAAVAFHTAGALGKLFSEVNENIDRGPLEGMTAAGASWSKRMRWAVLPQVLPNYTSYMLLRFEINIRASAILGFVGAGGIGTELRKAISWANGADIAALFVLLFVTIMIIDQTSGYLRRRLVGGMFGGGH